MNKRQKIVQRSLVKNELQVLYDLTTAYEEALDSINDKIFELMARNDTQNIQSIIYQVKYQKALKGQIEGYLDKLRDNNYKTISEYLKDCYNESWIGTLYDLQGQKVPLLLPINQEEVIKAINLDTKLSTKLYTKLGTDMDLLKKDIQEELSRCISQSYSYDRIAKAIKERGNATYNNSLRIAKTEGHRISQESTLNCQMKAKSKGANIMKQWDSTLDGKTRPNHQLLDGQLVEVDKPFNVGGLKAMFPGGFGIAREDVNCRCVLLQRAKWALSDEEFTKINGETNELVHFESVEDYDKFKAEFWKWSERAND